MSGADYKNLYFLLVGKGIESNCNNLKNFEPCHNKKKCSQIFSWFGSDHSVQQDQDRFPTTSGSIKFKSSQHLFSKFFFKSICFFNNMLTILFFDYCSDWRKNIKFRLHAKRKHRTQNLNKSKKCFIILQSKMLITTLYYNFDFGVVYINIKIHVSCIYSSLAI